MDDKAAAAPHRRGLFTRSLVADAEHGPLPGLLVVMTMVTGIVDAVSVLALGRVFVANMTGNVVFLIAVVASEPFDATHRSLLAGLIAVAMGIQNAVVRHLAVPDLTTTVLTMTMVGLAADRPTDNQGSRLIRRLLAIVALLLGAVVGAEIVLHGHVWSALLVTVALLGAVAIGAAASVRSSGQWRR